MYFREVAVPSGEVVIPWVHEASPVGKATLPAGKWPCPMGKRSIPWELAELVHARRPEDLRTGGLVGLRDRLQGDHHGLGAGRHLLRAELDGRSGFGGEDAAAHRVARIGHEPELVGLALGRRRHA